METKDCAVNARVEFCFIYEEQRFSVDLREVTAGDIRKIVGNIPDDVPIVLVLDDGTQRTLSECDRVELEQCRHFKRLPRFRRG